MQTDVTHQYRLLPFSKEGVDSQVEFHVSLTRSANELQFHFRLSGPGVSRLVWPVSANGVSAPQRRDELWKTTVFELFLAADGDHYFELNLSPNGDWNVYQFASYRAEMSQASGQLRSPLVRASKTDEIVEVSGVLNLQTLRLTGPVGLGATAVLEYESGRKEYWALAHKGEKPDFHLRSSFTARL